MKINLRIRFQNKAFWVALIPALLILVQAGAAVFGYTLDFSDLSGKLLALIDAIFVVLAILGIAVDPTTPGVGDSERALNRSDLNENEVDE